MWPNLTKKSVVNSTTFELPQLKSDGSNKNDFFCPDVVGSKRFCLNYGCHPRSDVSMINEQTSLEAAQHMLNELVDFRFNEPSTDGVSDTEILLGLRSKYCQAPAEQIAFYEGELARLQNKRAYEAAEAAKKAEKTISFEENKSES